MGSYGKVLGAKFPWIIVGLGSLQSDNKLFCEHGRLQRTEENAPLNDISLKRVCVEKG